MKKKSIASNYILNLIKTTLAILFPLISYPYISRILSVDGLGAVNFASSYVNYFILFSTFGINVFAIREGAKYRDDLKLLSNFATNMLLINIGTALVSFVALVLSLQLPALSEYRSLILIFSLSILFNTFGMEWYFQLMEEYRYITIRAILFQILSMILLFTFVKTADHIYIYAFITVFANVGSQCFNIFKLRNELVLFKETHYHIKEYVRPMFFIFLTLLAMNLYRFFDVTLLGFIKDDYSVGLYTLATKIVNIITTMVSSVTVILTPRLAYYFKNNQQLEFEKVAEDAFDFLMMLGLPIMIGIFIFSPFLVELVGGESFQASSIAVRILSPMVLISSLNGLLVTPILMVVHREKIVLRTFIIALIFNVSSNLLSIFYLDFLGAALTTIFTELLICIFAIYNARDILHFGNRIKQFFIYALSSFVIFPIWKIVSLLTFHHVVQFLLVILISIILYFLLLLIQKERLINFGLSFLQKKLGRR
ncbi:flippase [Streptococcus suis]|uniref:flippase n=1 Tax=Streptococcus suis TaxID=1307 RepID=UPI001ABDF88D|nr:flippase [Streptococcus suis]